MLNTYKIMDIGLSYIRVAHYFLVTVFFAGMILLFVGMSSVAHAVQIGNLRLEGSLEGSTDYVWRGLTQTGEEAAASLGFEVGFTNGIYGGAWASSIEIENAGNYELDYYFGYRGEIKWFSYDVGILRYTYPGSVDSFRENFIELYGGLGAGPVSFTWHTLADADNDALKFGDENYYALDLEFELPLNFGIGAHAGQYDKVDGKYNEYAIWLSIIGVRLTYSDVKGIKLENANIMIDDFVPAIDRESRLVVSYAYKF